MAWPWSGPAGLVMVMALVSRFVSHHISQEQVQRSWDAGVYAYSADRPLNRLVTIHLKEASIEPHRAHAFITAFLKHGGDWMRKRTGIPAHYLWVLENPAISDDGYGGLHTHILIHVPAPLLPAFRPACKGWLTQCGGHIEADVLDVRPVRHSNPGDNREEYLRHGLLGLLRYMHKGIEPSAASKFGIKAVPQGVIVGKRLGYSEALGGQHRWKRSFPYPGKPVWVAGADSRRRHMVRHIVPELLGLPAEEDE